MAAVNFTESTAVNFTESTIDAFKAFNNWKGG